MNLGLLMQGVNDEYILILSEAICSWEETISAIKVMHTFESSELVTFVWK